MLSKTELEVLIRLLDLAGEEFATHTSNDFELLATDANKALVVQAEPDFEPNIVNGKIIISDTALMDFLTRRCEEELHTMP
jgi:hypothetical protein